MCKVKHWIAEQIRQNKAAFIVYCVLRTLVVLTGVRAVYASNYESVFICLLTLVLMFMPSFLEQRWHIELPSTLEIIILLFIFCAEILGEIHSFYVKIPFWDSILHGINGFLCAAIGFALVDLLNANARVKFQLSPFYLAIVAFCFSMTIGVLWEFFEFFCDVVLKTDMQKDYVVQSISSVLLNPNGTNTAVQIPNIASVAVNGEPLPINGYLDIGLYDTMKDLILNFFGAIVFSVIGYFYAKNRGKGNFAKRFIPIVHKKHKNSKTDSY